ncbi:MAG: polysaccharide deacetylase family protein [Clostridia bacterium]|nr:polysaccharide deacetylase family protein [Clostridia bacterium]
MRKTNLIALVLAFTLVLLSLLGAAGAEGLRDCHRVTLEKVDETQANKSIVRVWRPTTALSSVTEELTAIEDAYVADIAPTLPKGGNATSSSSRVDVEIRYSRTGLSWMSFVIQARVSYHRKLTSQSFTTRTYDMESGERITMRDLFEDDSPAWRVIAQEVRRQLSAYFPSEIADEAALDELCTLEALQAAEFSLHGYSLVLHYPSELLYPDHHTLMEVTVMYGSIHDDMQEEAQIQTDNLSYYKTCALTFDDGPVRTNTTLVLQSLMQEGCRATFFVVGNRISSYEDLVQREHDEGHAVAMHNWHHGNVSKSSGAALRAMKEKCDSALIKAIGIPARYDRVPYGLYHQMISAKAGWPYIQWSLDTYDWRGLSTATVLSEVKRQIQDGDIILCHDIKDNTPASAQKICEYLTENGYMLLTIDELFAKDGITLENEKVYFRCADGDTSIKK